MNLRPLTKLPNFFRKKGKESLLAGGLIFVSALISLIPGANHFIQGASSLTFSIFSLDDYFSILLFSLLSMLPSLILFSATYLVWESHPLGWKLSLCAGGVAVLLALVNSGFMYFALPVTLLCCSAALLEVFAGKLQRKQTRESMIIENLAKFAFRLSALFCISVLVVMIVFMIMIASPWLSFQFFTSMNLDFANVSRIVYGLNPIGSVGGVLSCTIGTLLVVTFCEFVAVPIGICAAIYLAEYSGQNRVVGTIRFFVETLAGSPSIIMAIIGYSIFTVTLHWQWSLYSAGIALSFMALPWNIRIAEEAIKQVPRSYREASFALGATQWQTARLVTLYAAMPGIITGILLGIGVAIGETLVLLWNYSGATLTGLPSPWWHIFNIKTQLPSLTVFIDQIPGNNQAMKPTVVALKGANTTHAVFLTYSLALAAGVVLVTIYLGLCVVALLIRNYLNKRMKGA
jgi:phosphate transport system permease protein